MTKTPLLLRRCVLCAYWLGSVSRAGSLAVLYMYARVPMRAGIGGIGGPHIGHGSVWPMSLTMLALTSDDDEEILTCLEQLKVSSAGTGFLHESFNQHDVTDFTRPWFAW